jgi:hypothetical protein
MPIKAPFDSGRLAGWMCSTCAGTGLITGGEYRVAAGLGWAAGVGVLRGIMLADKGRPIVATTF